MAKLPQVCQIIHVVEAIWPTSYGVCRFCHSVKIFYRLWALSMADLRSLWIGRLGHIAGDARL